MRITIVKSKPSTVKNLITEYIEELKRINRNEKNSLSKNAADIISKKKWETFIAKINNEPVGFINFRRYIFPKQWREGAEYIYIWDIFVKPEWRGKRIGKLLIKKVIEEAKKRGIKYVLLSSLPERLEFYKKLGFEVESIIMEYKIK